ncbi:hypothetical protein GPLA_2839 [Paraglaciecola polaris LMG 21857]|uniref:Uncharacterized protein n=1 Tax=Paraglaciecola polaris LMG 21857 TaxID=1129793 RepID=K6ZYB2_9ALTE|nr:hypothetical protein GPLA_2839 [Paraglaciecola polaris LMG 21857]
MYLHFMQLSVTTKVMSKILAERYGRRSYLLVIKIQDGVNDEQVRVE